MHFLLMMFTKKKGTSRKGSPLLFITPIFILLLGLVMYFMLSDFWIYAQMLLLQQKHSDGEYTPSYSSGWSDSEHSGGSLGSPLGGDYGDVLVNSAGVSVKQASYIKDWLTIVRDTCNWSLQQPGAELGAGGYKPNVAFVLGTLISETSIGKDYIPTSLLNPAKYHPRYVDKDGNETYSGDYNLYRYDHTSVNNPDLPPTVDNTWKVKEAANGVMTTVFQMNANWAKYWPNTTLVPGGYGRYPSLLNPVSYNGGGTRPKGESDGAFFPDQIAAKVQWTHAQYVLESNIDFSACTGAEYTTAAWTLYNAGLYSPRSYLMASGDKDSTFRVQNMKKSTALAASMPFVHNAFLKAGKYFCQQDISDSEFVYHSPDYYNVRIQYIMLANGAFFLNKTTYDECISWMNSNIDSALLCYRAGKNDYSITKEQMIADSKNWYKTLDSAGYPRYTKDEGVIFWLDTKYNVTYTGASKSVPLLHGVASGGLRASMAMHIGGPYIYWRALLSCGVQCTRQQAYDDVFGNCDMADLISTQGVSNIGDYIAKISSDWALPSSASGSVAWQVAKGSAYTRCGTALYIFAKDRVRPNNGLYASCDAHVCTAVRTSGADDGYPISSVTNQLKYMEEEIAKDNPKWKEIFWYDEDTKTFHPEMLQPGDVFLFSSAWETAKKGLAKDTTGTGHTYIYATKEVIDESFGDIDHLNGTCIHASVHQYAPAVGGYDKWGYFTNGWAKRPYRVFRCVRPDDPSKFAGTYEEGVASVGITHTPA